MRLTPLTPQAGGGGAARFVSLPLLDEASLYPQAYDFCSATLQMALQVDGSVI